MPALVSLAHALVWVVRWLALWDAAQPNQLLAASSGAAVGTSQTCEGDRPIYRAALRGFARSCHAAGLIAPSLENDFGPSARKSATMLSLLPTMVTGWGQSRGGSNGSLRDGNCWILPALNNTCPVPASEVL